jgi:hypothetical protein
VKPFAGSLVVLLAASVSAMAEVLPSGEYSFSGTVTAAFGNFCPVDKKEIFSGTIAYPGAGSDQNLIITLRAISPGVAVKMALLSAFPPIPASGLNGWSQSSPAASNYTQFRNGKVVAGGASAQVSFDLTTLYAGPFAAAQGTIMLDGGSNGPCKEQFLGTLQRVSDY